MSQETKHDLVAMSAVKDLLGLSRSGHNTELILSSMARRNIVPHATFPFAGGTARYYKRGDILAFANDIRKEVEEFKEKTAVKMKAGGKAGGEAKASNLHAKLDDIIARLDRLESMWTNPQPEVK